MSNENNLPASNDAVVDNSSQPEKAMAVSTAGGSSAVAELLRRLPTTTVHQSRLQLYQPTRRPVWEERKIITPWGHALVRGKIGQVHADIVEAICRNAEDHRTVPGTGQLQILVDPYKVRVSVGGGKAYSHDTLWKMLTELRETSITLEAPAQGLKILGGIIERVEESSATKHNKLNGRARAMWRVTLDAAFAAMLRDDLHLYYDPTKLARLEKGIAQAIARHIMTHRDQPNGGWLVDSLIALVGANPDGDSTTLRNRRRELQACAASLAELGILIEDGRVRRVDKD